MVPFGPWGNRLVHVDALSFIEGSLPAHRYFTTDTWYSEGKEDPRFQVRASPLGMFPLWKSCAHSGRGERASSKYITHLYEKFLRSQVWKRKAHEPRYSEVRVQSHKDNCSKQKGKKESWGKFSTRLLV